MTLINFLCFEINFWHVRPKTNTKPYTFEIPPEMLAKPRIYLHNAISKRKFISAKLLMHTKRDGNIPDPAGTVWDLFHSVLLSRSRVHLFMKHCGDMQRSSRFGPLWDEITTAARYSIYLVEHSILAIRNWNLKWDFLKFPHGIKGN